MTVEATPVRRVRRPRQAAYSFFNGGRVTDARADMVLSVSSRDVSHGDPSNPENCAIARSAKRSCTDYAWIGVNVALIQTGWDDEGAPTYERYLLSKEARAITKIFDEAAEHGYTKAFLPGEYVLLAPSGRQRIGTRRGEQPGSDKREGKARSVHNAKPRRGTLRLYKRPT